MLQSLFEQNQAEIELSPNDKGKRRALGERPAEDFDLNGGFRDEDNKEVGLQDPGSTRSHTKAVYEVVQHGEHLQPRLRIWIGSSSSSSVVEEGKGGQAAPGVSIKLDKPDSPTETRSPLPEALESEFTEKQMLLVSRPIMAVPGQSLVWSLQRKTAPYESESPTPSDTSLELDESKQQAHPVELVKRRYVFIRMCLRRRLDNAFIACSYHRTALANS